MFLENLEKALSNSNDVVQLWRYFQHDASYLVWRRRIFLNELRKGIFFIFHAVVSALVMFLV